MRTTPLLLVPALLAACGGSGGSYGPAPAPIPRSSLTPSSEQPINDGGTRDARGLRSVDVAATDFRFSPSTIVATPGQVLTLVVHNASGTLHNLSQTGQRVDRNVQPGATVSLTMTVPATGDLIFTCSFHAASGMAGTVGPSTAPRPTVGTGTGGGYYGKGTG